MTVETPLLFLGGAGLPPWIWDEVRAGLGSDRTSAAVEYPKGTTAPLSDYTTKALDAAPAGEFIVVAHSVGGVVGAQLLSEAPERVTGFLGIAASFPTPGRSFFGSLPFPSRMLLSVVTRLAGTRPPDKAIRATLTAGLEEPQVRRILQEFDPESQALYRTPVSSRRVPALRGYIETTNDRELSHTLQQRFARTLDAQRTATLPTGHLPMLEDPPATLAAIKKFLQGEK